MASAWGACTSAPPSFSPTEGAGGSSHSGGKGSGGDTTPAGGGGETGNEAGSQAAGASSTAGTGHAAGAAGETSVSAGGGAGATTVPSAGAGGDSAGSGGAGGSDGSGGLGGDAAVVRCRGCADLSLDQCEQKFVGMSCRFSGTCGGLPTVCSFGGTYFPAFPSDCSDQIPSPCEWDGPGNCNPDPTYCGQFSSTDELGQHCGLGCEWQAGTTCAEGDGAASDCSTRNEASCETDGLCFWGTDAAGKCVGTPKPCAEACGQNCDHDAACLLPANYPADPCAAITDPNECDNNANCVSTLDGCMSPDYPTCNLNWTSSMQCKSPCQLAKTCSGTPTSCGLFKSPFNCEDQPGCSWQAASP